MSNRSPRPIIVGVAGGSGSGKTAFCQSIFEQVGEPHVSYLSHDSYYRDYPDLARAERRRINYDHPDALENELSVAHLKALKAGHAVKVPIYDFVNHRRKEETRPIELKPILLLEGILVLVDERLRELMTLKIYLDAPPDVRFIRRLERDIAERGRTVEGVIQQYLSTVRPMHLKFVEPSKRHADLIIPGGGLNQMAIQVVAGWLRGILRG